MAHATISDLRRFYAGRRVLVTGHTGFKGGWLALWLNRLGAEVHGCALPPDQGPDSLFEKGDVTSHATSVFADIRNAAQMAALVQTVQPEVVFHLAARALVQQGYEDPLGAFDVNVQGTASVLEAARQCESVRAVVCVTTDKVYLNREWPWPYRETDELGGLDPYSASKAAAELVARTYQNALKPKDRPFNVATARGGNVIGGGDWSPFRLVPDIVRAIQAETPLTLRYPGATRPWQHVLDLCYGYILLGHRLAAASPSDRTDHAAWNFGPAPDAELTVSELVSAFLEAWGDPSYPVERGEAVHYESMTLRLDPSLANRVLGWQPGLDARTTVAWTADWYRAYVTGSASAGSLVLNQIERFEAVLDSRA